jgi:uncharacterized membrane protein YbhN (UPF0104 family)
MELLSSHERPRITDAASRSNRDLHKYAARAAGYALALAIVWWVARKITVAELIAAFSKADLWLLLPACALSVSCWVLGESYLYARLISYFHQSTSFREMLPINAAQEFFQVVNKATAGSSLVLYMHRCKGAAWMSAGCTLIFLALIDMVLLIALAAIVSIVEPAALMGAPRWSPWLVLVLIAAAIAVLKSGRDESILMRWLAARPSLETFRRARFSHYARLIVIRTPIYAAQGVVLYLELLAFGLRVPLLFVFAFIPMLTLASSVPLAPGGIGPRQAATVVCLAAFGPAPSLLAMSLGHSLGTIAFRLPLGIFTPAYFRSVLPERASSRSAA